MDDFLWFGYCSSLLLRSDLDMVLLYNHVNLSKSAWSMVPLCMMWFWTKRLSSVQMKCRVLWLVYFPFGCGACWLSWHSVVTAMGSASAESFESNGVEKKSWISLRMFLPTIVVVFFFCTKSCFILNLICFWFVDSFLFLFLAWSLFVG